MKQMWKLKYGHVVTQKLIDTLKYGFDEESWNVVMIVGPTGSGKSRVAVMLAQWMKEYIKKTMNLDVEIHLSRNIVDTQQIFMTAKKHSIIVQDESTHVSGYGSKGFIDFWTNLMDTMRYSEVNVIYCAPFTIKELRTHQIILEVYRKNKKQRKTELIMYDPEQIALGFAYVKILDKDHPENVRYDEFKSEMVKELKLRGGRVSGSVPPEIIRADVELVLNALKNEPAYKDIDLSELKMREVLNQTTMYVAGDVKYQEGIADLVLRMIQKEKKGKDSGEIPITVEPKGLAEEWLPPLLQEPTVRNDQLYDLIYKYSKPLNEHERLGREYWYNYYARGMTQENASTAACETVGKTYTRQAFVIKTGFLSAFMESPNCFGQGVEKAVRDLYFVDYIHHGGVGEPDLIGPDMDAVEIKGRTIEKDGYKRLSKNLRKAVEDQKYMRELVANETPITVVGVDVGKKKQGCWVTVGKVNYG